MTDYCTGEEIYNLVKKLFPLPRSLTGKAFRESLTIIKEEINNLEIKSIASGTQCFDWTVPPEWVINDAYIIAPDGEKICDFKISNLHLVHYSEPMNKKIHLEELEKHLHSIPELPDAIPYITSFYERDWGFCLSQNERDKLKPGLYQVYIDSSFNYNGELNYGELLIPGKLDKEIFFSTYLCHPSMANNELSGPAIATYLAKYLLKQNNLNYSYRFIFIPETIGSIAYLSKNKDLLKDRVVAGMVLNCIGDDNKFSFLPSKEENTLADKVAVHVLKFMTNNNFNSYSFLERGSDERQYCWPGIDLPICSIMRSKYGEYPEYHTSLDDLSFVSSKGFQKSFEVLTKFTDSLELNKTYTVNCLCEPQLSKRQLYPSRGDVRYSDYDYSSLILNFLVYCDGKNDLLSIAEIINYPIWELKKIADQLEKEGLVN